MRARRLAGGVARVAAAVLAVTGVVAGVPAAGAAAASCVAWTGTPPPSPGGPDQNNFLQSVAVLSPCAALAVGGFTDGTSSHVLIARWDGSSWTQANTPDPANASLSAVAATSAHDAWAVGDFTNGTAAQTLILHWDGSAWTKVPSPSPGGSAHSSQLLGVRATSATNAWAVGSFSNGTADQTLLLHWDGTSWTQVTTPNPSATGNELDGVGASSARDAWAVGSFSNGKANQTLILHWDGSSWTQVKSPNPGGSAQNSALTSVRATSARDAWAVGQTVKGTVAQTLIAHWDGSSWKRVPSPNPSAHQQRAPRRRRHLRQERVGGGRLQQRHREPDPDPALGRLGVEADAIPEPLGHA